MNYSDNDGDLSDSEDPSVCRTSGLSKVRGNGVSQIDWDDLLDEAPVLTNGVTVPHRDQR